MKFRYRGALDEYHLSPTKVIFPSVLHYRKMVYSLEIQSSNCSPEISPAKLPVSGDRDRKIYSHSWQKTHCQKKSKPWAIAVLATTI